MPNPVTAALCRGSESRAAARGVPEGKDCISPASHSAFGTPVEMMHFIAKLRQLSGGKPVGFKLCIGHPWEWFALVKAMLAANIPPDFIVVEGAEGGTGAAPVAFSDQVGAPVQEGLQLVHNTLIGVNLRSRISAGEAGNVTSAATLHALQELQEVQELVQAAGLQHLSELNAHHNVRRVSATEIRLLSNLIMRMASGVLLGPGQAAQGVQRLLAAGRWPMQTV